MTRPLPRPRRRPFTVRRSGGVARPEDGFILLESIVALSLITVIMAVLGTFTLRTVAATNDLRARQAAAQVATTALATVDSLPASDVIQNHDKSSVDAEFAGFSGNPTVQAALNYMSPAYQTTPTPVSGAGATAAIPTVTTTTTLNSVAYGVTTFVGTCVIPSVSDEDANPPVNRYCVKSGSGTSDYRVVVAVTWSGRGCSSIAVCTFVTSTLVNATADPVFNTNSSTPPASPIVVAPGDQTSTVGGAVSLQMQLKSGTGVNPIAWSLVNSTSLPSGLTLDANSGVVSGTPQSTQSATAVTVQASDAFGRTGTTTFNWTVVAAPTITTPAAQSSVVGTAITPLTPTSTCPDSPCTFAMTGAPAGLSIDASSGKITGTPTTAGTSSNVVVTITDAAGVGASTNTFTWTVTPAKPSVGDPGTRTVTVGQNVSLPISYTCPSTPCTVRLTNTVSGLGLTGSSTTTGNNTTTSGSVSATSGTFYIAGTVQSGAVTSGSSTSYAPVLSITDSTGQTVTSATGSWTAYTAPTLTALGDKTVRVLETSSVALSYTCPVASCTITLTGTVTGLGLSTSSQTSAVSATSLAVTAASGTVYYTGKVDSGAVSSGYSATYTPKITITDADSISASTSGTWTVKKSPILTNPGTQAMKSGQNLSLQMATTCPNGGCTSWTLAYQTGTDTNYYAINGNISSSGLITYNNPPAATYSLRVTVTDSAGQTDTTTFVLKVVSSMTVSVPNQTTSKPSTGSTVVTVDVSKLVDPTADGYTYSLSSQPSWLTIDPASGLMTATVTSSSSTDSSITVTVKSNASSGSTATSTFSWTIK